MTKVLKSQMVKAINDDITKNFEEFLNQAKYKLSSRKRPICFFKEDYRELVSDIIFSVLERCNNISEIRFFYGMVNSNMFKNYIFKAIDNNTKSPKSPWLKKKLEEQNRIINNDDIFNELCDNNLEEQTPNMLLTITLFDGILPNENKMRQLFGKNYKYYRELINIYLNPEESDITLGKKSCYSKIDRSHNLRNTAYHYRKIWAILRKELNNNKK